MKSNTTRHYLFALALVLTLVSTPMIASANTDTSSAQPTVTLSLASWNSPVLPRIVLSADDAPPFLAQTGEQGAPVDVYGFKRKSPTRAFLQSFLIPGWGQYYARSSFWKPIMFVGIEAAGLAGYMKYRGNGSDAEDLYRDFADVHWDSTRYVDGLYHTFFRRDKPESIKDAWLDTTTYVVVDNQNNIYPRSLSHHAWYKGDGTRVESNEYYENVGKYNQFNFGWDDFPAIGSENFPDNPDDSAKFEYVSPNRQTYLGMRDDANAEFNKANTMLVATVANHLLAGFWAAFDARSYNRAQDQFSHFEPSLRLVKSPSNPTKLMPFLTVGYRF